MNESGRIEEGAALISSQSFGKSVTWRIISEDEI